jgi:hypothetical protein
MINAAIRSALKSAAKHGEGGDTDLAHVSEGDVAVPRERITPAVRKDLERILGKDLPRFTVGKTAKRNRVTGLASFDDGDGGGGDTGGGGGSDSAGGPGDPAGSPGDGSAADSSAGGGTGTGAGTGVGDGTSGGPGSVDMGGTGPGIGGAPSSGGVQGGNSVSGGANGMGVGGGNASGGANAGPGQGVAGADGSPSGAPGVDTAKPGLFAGITARDIMAAIANMGLGAIPGIGQAISGANLAGRATGVGTLGDALADHGVDQAGNPGGNMGGSGPGMTGSDSDPGSSSGGDSQRGAFTDVDIANALFGAPGSAGRAGRVAGAVSSAGAPAGALGGGSSRQCRGPVAGAARRNRRRVVEPEGSGAAQPDRRGSALSLDKLFSLPSEGGLDIWSFDHAQNHLAIKQAIQRKLGVNLPQYVLDPIPQDFQSWLALHQSAHSDMNGQLGLQSSDLTSLDFKDPQQLRAWFFLNYQEHFDANTALKI